jgi:hypothetical protein
MMHNSRHHIHPRSRRLSLPQHRLVHGPLPSTCLVLLPDMLLVGTSPCTSRVRVAQLGLARAVASEPPLLVLPTEMRHLRRPDCAHHLMGPPSLRR